MNALAETAVDEAPSSPPPRLDANLSSLVKTIDPLTPEASINEVSELFLAPETQQLLSIPIVQRGRVVGIVSRYQLMKIYMKMYGREVYGRRPVSSMMNATPLLVEFGQSIEEASHLITERMQFPIMDDFVIIEQGRYVGLGVVIDVLKAMEERIERKNRELAQAYSRLKSSQLQLIQSEKMASLGQMVAGVAHELNTPLGYVKNNVEMVNGTFSQTVELLAAHHQLYRGFVGELEDETQLEQAVGVIEQYADDVNPEVMADMGELLNDTLYGLDQIRELVVSLKNFARLDQAKTDNINLNDCIDSALVIARNNLKKRAEVVKQYGDLPKISCSPSQINQIFLNLLNNAVQAMEQEGEIVITTWTDDEFVNASVTDPGKGIPPESLPRIFDPFFTTKPMGEGTGLGLAICFQIVQQHKGRIRVKSRPGEGTTFTIRLPRQDRPPPAGSISGSQGGTP